MKSLFIILLAGYAVRCNENNYYVIEMQDPPTHTTPQPTVNKPFSVYWNVPTMQCRSKNISFDNLYEKYGIIQNEKDKFKGEKVTILYDPGLFPAIFKNESGGKFRFRNGGVPQDGNLNIHLEAFKKELDLSIPDKKYSGIGIIDFESWRPQFRQNFGVLQPYKDESIKIEKKLHWWWRDSWIKEEAQRRFEEAARVFMQSTLSVAKRLRPAARWGFYGFPYCFNMASNNLVEACANGVPRENDQISWLWGESSALYPSVYSSAQLSSAQLVALVRGRVREAARNKARPEDLILPYFWFRYRDAGFLTETDLSVALSTLYKSAAAGIIIWGSSNDVNTVDKCKNLKNYVQNVLGPAIAKYTKPITKDNDEDETTLSPDTTESHKPNLVPNTGIDLDPEFNWMPTENYTQIKNETEEPITNTFGQRVTNSDTTVLQNDSVLIDLIFNRLPIKNSTITTTDNPKTKYEKKNRLQNEFEINTTANKDTSQNSNVPLVNTTNNRKYTSQNIEIASSVVSLFDDITTTETIEFQTDESSTDLQMETETVDTAYEAMMTTQTFIEETTENDYDFRLDDDDDNFYNSNPFFLFSNNETTDTVDDQALNTESTKYTDFTKNEKKIQSYIQKLGTKDIEISTDKSINIPTTDVTSVDGMFLILEESSTKFIDTKPTISDESTDTPTTYQTAFDGMFFILEESSTKPVNETDEEADEEKYITESNNISINTTATTTTYDPFEETSSIITTTTEENVLFDSIMNNFEQNDTRKSYENELNHSNLPTTNTNLNYKGLTNLPNGISKVEFDTKVLDTSKTTEFVVTEETSTSISQGVSKIRESEDTEVTPIVSSTEQVDVY